VVASAPSKSSPQEVCLKRLFLGLLICALVACTRTETTTTTETSATDTTATISASDTTGTIVTTDTAATGTTATSATGTTGTTATTATAATKQEKPMSSNPYENKVAVLNTTAGEIDIRFFPDVAPNHVKNFIDLANQGFYNGIKFHRVIPGFMIQGGDPNTIKGNPNTWGMGGSPNKLKAEFNSISHKRGIVSAARTQDPNSASSQFFIVTSDSTFLDNQYTVFGQVVKGMDVADKIVNAAKDANDRPNNPTTITSVTIREAGPGETGPAPK
jgi:cyclophilin family peptidyl-prolyl cis-trans isomerase